MAGLNTPRVLLKDDADTRVIEFTPREFPNKISEAAVKFVKFQATENSNDFKIDRIVSMTTGIAELEKISLSERVEAEALVRLKAMQEEAYQQGYDLGRDEGQESAYLEKTQDLSQRISQIDAVVSSLTVLKNQLVKQNEVSLVELVFKIAEKIAMTELKMNPELVMAVLQQAAAETQDEESIVIRLAQSDIEFIEAAKTRLGQEFEFLKRAKIEASAEVVAGGCMLITNFGQVDATVEKRIEKVWQSLHEKLPKKTDVLEKPSTDGGENT
jgi:flagellar assembly protein FliH